MHSTRLYIVDFFYCRIFDLTIITYDTGAYGRVYMGLNLDSGELIAVKQVCIAQNNITKERAQAHIRELEEEVKLLQNLSHPNIVRYLGTAREEEALNIFLEFVPGGSISSLLGKFGSFTEPVIRMYTRQLLLGLEYLHSNHIMHRDIKGANILVDNKGCIKLADFGASKKVVELATISEAKSMKGTPYWMAPEVIRQTGHNWQADMWSVGCTVIEMATGKPPWSQQFQEVAALFHIGTTKSHPPIPEHLSPHGKDFLLKLLQREPRKRPSATEMLKHPFVQNWEHHHHGQEEAGEDRQELERDLQPNNNNEGCSVRTSMSLRNSIKDTWKTGSRSVKDLSFSFKGPSSSIRKHQSRAGNDSYLEDLNCSVRMDSVRLSSVRSDAVRDSVRDSMRLGSVRDSINFGSIRDSMNFGSIRDSMNFGSLRDSMNFGSVRESMKFSTLRESLKFGSVRDSMRLGSVRDSMRLGSVRFGANRNDTWNESFNPISEPSFVDGNKWRMNLTTNGGFSLRPPSADNSEGSGTLQSEQSLGGRGWSLQQEEEDEVTESKIRAFLDEKALELKKLQTPLYEEFNDSLRTSVLEEESATAAVAVGPAESFIAPLSPAVAKQPTTPSTSKSPSKASSVSGRSVGLRSSQESDTSVSSGSPSGSGAPGTSVNFTPLLEIPSPKLNELKGLVNETQQQPLPSPGLSSSERQRLWKEELQQELQLKREEKRKITQRTTQTSPSPNSRALQRPGSSRLATVSQV